MGDEGRPKFTPGGLAAPRIRASGVAEARYPGVRRPVATITVDDMADLHEGRICLNCRGYEDPVKAQELIRKEQFWERAFGQHGDGSDLKPYMFGDLSNYSVCSRLGIVTSAFSTCPEFSDKFAFKKAFGKITGGDK